MVWYIIAGIAISAALAILIYSYVRDRRYERLKTSQAMSPELWQEIEEERNEAIKRRGHWRDALTKAQSEAKGGEHGPH